MDRLAQSRLDVVNVAVSPLPHLREVTAEQHRELENRLNLFRSDFSLDDYRSVLKRFYGFWRPWEVQAARALGEGYADFFEGRRRSRALRMDLRHLGFAESSLEELPSAQQLPELDSIDAALGSMYVTEGSTLGGQLLSRHFIQRVGVLPEQCTFFSGYGSATGSMWKQFGVELAKRPVSSYPLMAIAANQTFRSLGEWL